MRKPIVIKMNVLILMALFMFVYVPSDPNYTLEDKLGINNGKQMELGRPKAAYTDFYYFAVNGTQLYEDGIYYCFQSDRLSFFLNTSADIPHIPLGNVFLEVESFLTPLEFSYTSGTASYKIWEAELEIPSDKDSGNYNATLTIDNSSVSSTFLFNISIMNPQPRILKTIFEDTVFGEGPRQIFEKERLGIYHNSEINISCNVVNDDGLSDIKSVKLEYQNGNATRINTIVLQYKGTVTIGSYVTREYALDSLLTIDLGSTSTEARSNWTSGYKFSFNLITEDYDTDTESYYFPWDVIILNQAPKINQFDVSGDIGQSALESANKLNFYAVVDFDDLETDMMFGDSLYNYAQKIAPSRGYNGTGITGFVNNATDLILNPSDGKSMEFTIQTGGEFYIDYGLGRNFDFNDNDIISEWLLTLRFITAATVPTLQLSLWDYNAGAWSGAVSTDLLQGRTNQENGFSVQYLNSSGYISNIKNYFETVNQTNIFRLRLYCSANGGLDSIKIDFTEMMLKFNRKVGASDIIIKILEPTTSFQPIKVNEEIKNPGPISINIKNIYDMDWAVGIGGTNKWVLNYTVSVSDMDYKFKSIGVWTFILEVYDFGAKPYSEYAVEEINGINQWSQVSYPGTESNLRGLAVATKSVRVGLDWDDTIYVENVEIDHPNPNPDENSTIDVTIHDNDATNAYKNLTEFCSPNLNSFRIQDGLDWNGPFNNYNMYNLPPIDQTGYSKDVLDRKTGGIYKYILKDGDGDDTDPGYVLKNNSENFRFKIFEENFQISTNYFAYYISFKLDMKYWLSEKNITGIWLNITQNMDPTNQYELTGAQINFWSFKNNSWIVPNYESIYEEEKWQAGTIYPGQNQNTLNKFVTDVPYGNMTWQSPKWDNTTHIQECINENQDNLVYMRVLMHRIAGLTPQATNYNISIDHIQLGVQYKNDYTCKIKLWDSIDNTPKEFNMTQLSSGVDFRTWTIEIPTSLLTARSYAFRIEAQNGNTSIYYMKGQYVGQPSGNFFEYSSDYIMVPYYNGSINSNNSYVFRSKPENVSISINYSPALIIHRQIDPLQFDGTINPQFCSIDEFERVYVELRQYKMSSADEWVELNAKNYLDPVASNAFTVWNNITNTWNTSIIFGYDYGSIRWASGLWYYRLVIKTNDSITNATDWGRFRLQNYQPKNIQIDDIGDTYRRVRDNVEFQLSFVDIEGDNSTTNNLYDAGNDYRIKIFFKIYNRDIKGWEIWDSNTLATYNSYISNRFGNPAANRFVFDGSFTFGREINVSVYNEMYIRIEDLDPDWPQVGTLKITDQYFDIRNNPPQPNISLRTNSTIDNKDQVYRNNWFNIYCEIFDYDDFPENITLYSFNGTVINNSNSIIFKDYSSDFLFNSLGNPELEQWQMNFFVDRHNKTGTWNFTVNFFDPDGDFLEAGAMNLSVNILNNLPVLTNIRFENLDTGQIGYLSNQTLFSAYRGETVNIVADIYDVEDTWIEDYEYQIKEVAFDLINEYSKLPNGNEVYSDASYIFEIVKNGTVLTSDSLGSTSIFDPRSYSIEARDSQNAIITVLQDQGGDTATLADITTNDNDYHDIAFQRSPLRPAGGTYYLNITGLPEQFDVHSTLQIVNITFDYQVFSGGPYNVYIFNIETQKWNLLGNLNSPAWQNKTFPINSVDLRKYTTEENGNIVQLKINSTAEPPAIGAQYHLYIDQAQLSYFSIKNMRFERWEANVMFPKTIGLHAGELKFRLNLLDQDNGIGIDTTNTMNILNYRPEFTGTEVRMSINGDFINKNQENWVNYTTGEYPMIEIYVEAFDEEGGAIGLKSVSIYAKISDDVRTILTTITYQIASISVDGEANLYKIEILIDPDNRPEGLSQIKRFELISVTITDFDFGYNDPVKFPSSTSLNNIGLIVNFREEKDIQKIPDYVWIIVGVLGGVGLVSLSILFYRKFISYKKYLGDDE